MKFKSVAKSRAAWLPKTPGVYAFKNGGEFLYIGKAVNLKNRVVQHKMLCNAVKRFHYIKTLSENKALLLEAKLIKRHQPKYNTQWKDDKNYFYVGISKEMFPRVFVTHQTKKSEAQNPKLKIQIPQIDYIGPFVNGRELKQKLRELRKIHPYRTCKTLPQKPCLWFHLNQCPAPCLTIFSGQVIEAYDISNIQGQEATGAMVTFRSGKPDKNFYRRFKIKTVRGPNDIAMIKEVLTRRFGHPEWPYPDIMLIDGGKGQFNAAVRAKGAKTKNIKIVSLAKRNNELYIEGQKKPILLKNLPREFSDLILQARDEAHRFARAYHHLLRSKNMTTR